MCWLVIHEAYWIVLVVTEDIIRDAERWRALINSDRIRFLGAAGFNELDKVPAETLQLGVDMLALLLITRKGMPNELHLRV